ncbi:methyltransferase dimerization domain-containing protein [Brasilonema sp. UFV-L1]|uniref:methyltransferase dimerization domain-containing protein n=1 Tax=Brasilonema sp. UFV-L1 TaxID=2234130 RepID=UPI001B7D1958|nr:methyltransferase dimerization domain-containing protein [Brasilonema sp. UFV-L1]
MSMFHFPTLTVADEVGLFPFLDEAPATAEDVAKKLSLGGRATEALLGVLASLGYLVQHNGKFHLPDSCKNYYLQTVLTTGVVYCILCERLHYRTQHC